LVLLALQKEGAALKFASVELRGDRNIVSLAVHKNPLALKFASCDMQADKDIVMTAITGDGMAIHFCSAIWKFNVPTMLIALKNVQLGRFWDCISHLNERLMPIICSLMIEEVMAQEEVDFTDKGCATQQQCAAKRHAANWKRQSLEKLWLIGQMLGHSHKPVIGSIVEYANIAQEVHKANELAYFAPIFSIFASKDIGWRGMCRDIDWSKLYV
jgi:hypothetical protein